MPAWDAILNRVRYFGRRSQFDAELDDEILFHIETRADELAERGMSRKAAMEQARREFGSRTRAKEETRSAWQIPWLEDFWRDLCYAARGWRSSPGFTAVALMSLAIGVGANCAMFIVVDAMLLRPLTVYHPYEIITVHGTSLEAGIESVSWPDYVDLRNRNQSFSALVASTGVTAGFANRLGLPPRMRDGLMVSGNYFDVLGIAPAPGRGFLPQEDQVPGRDAVVVLSHALWKAEFSADRNIVGRQVSIAGIPFTVIGVTPPDFTAYDDSLTETYVDYFIPLAMAPRAGSDAGILTQRRTRSLAVTGRLKSGITVRQAQAELATIAAAIEKDYPESNRKQGMVVQSVMKYRASGFGGVAGLAVMLLSGGILLIACANVAGLLLGRAASRKREIAVRLSLGAGRMRLIRQLLTESLLLAVAGAVAGLAIVQVPLSLLRPIMERLVTTTRPAGDLMPLRLDTHVIVFCVVVALTSVLLSGLWPALHATRADLNVVMNGGGAPPRRLGRLWGRNILVGTQVAMAMVLLTATGVIYMWVHNARTAIDDAGFETSNTVVTTFDPLVKRYKPAQAKEFYSTLAEDIRAATGIPAITLASSGPATIRKDSASGPAESVLTVEADNNFFDAMGIPILQGRGFRSTDAMGTAPVGVINEGLVRSLWPHENPVGKRIRVGDDKSPWIEIIGVAKIRTYEGIFSMPPPLLVILPAAQSSAYPPKTLFVRSGGDRTALIAAARKAVRALDSRQAIPEIHPWGDQLQAFSSGIRIAAFVIGAMGSMGIGLALIGLYGMVTYDVGARTREIGVRMALGAPRNSLLRLTMWQGLALAFCGIVVGVVAVYETMQVLTAGLPPPGPNAVGVSWDVEELSALALVVLALAGLAAYIPARRATGVDCCEALRCE